MHEFSTPMRLAEIRFYPVKSLQGIPLSEATVERRGIRWDRRWMLVDEHGVFMTQRQFPKMARASVCLEKNHLEIRSPQMDGLIVPFELGATTPVTVEVWGDQCEALSVGEQADRWFSCLLGKACHLVYMPDHTRRPVSHDYAVDDDIVSFADAFPCLLTTEASLEDLNRRMALAVTMDRFRPNLVISGSEAFAEDRWKVLQIGSMQFHVVKPCARCSVPNVDQETGEIKGREPLETLAKYRTVDQQVLFGQNLIPAGEGVVRVDDEVRVIESV